jgi:two-component system, cell cycle response regulator
LTLRARLTAAFLAVVLGPVLLGAIFVGVTVTAVSRDRTAERLDRATGAVTAALDALCAQLRAGAEAAALLAAGGRGADAERLVVDQDLAMVVRLTGPSNLAPPGWVLCGQPRPAPDAPTRKLSSSPVAALAARVELRDPTGTFIGYAYAARPVDAALLARLTDTANRVAGTNGALLAFTAPGPYARRLASPLPLTVSVPEPAQRGLVPALLAVVLLAGVGAVGVAWWLARGTTRPLAELAAAADRVASGDLSARVPVRRRDEVGRLGTAFNRMTRGMQSYVAALTASRDQLRGHLDVLGDTLSHTHDLQRILEVILQTACAATGARSGVVLLIEDGELVGAQLRVPLGVGLLGTVASTGEPRRGRVDRDGPVLAPGEPACVTYMAVPFTAPDSVRGVLALYDRVGNDEFDDTDLVTLRTFAGQAAIAVENVRVHEEAQRLSHTDPLTGLYNYRTLTDSLRREVERASRFGHRLCVLVLDLDRFKDVNDSYGHAAGDAVLVEFARRVQSEIREVDLAFRQGGEEFALLLPETDAVGGIIVAERLGTVVRDAPVALPPRLPNARGERSGVRRIPVTVSIGIAVFPEHGGTGPVVLEAADEALYAAKQAGRDTYRLAEMSLPAVPGVVTVAGGASGCPHPALPSPGR